MIPKENFPYLSNILTNSEIHTISGPKNTTCVMARNSKIAVPTDDGIIVGENFNSSRGYLVATVVSGKIIHQEMRWNLLSEIMTSEFGSYYNLEDCDIILVNNIGTRHGILLKEINKTVVHTGETMINNAFCKYFESKKSTANKI
jgi:hypothetical protein